MVTGVVSEAFGPAAGPDAAEVHPTAAAENRVAASATRIARVVAACRAQCWICLGRLTMATSRRETAEGSG
ncbi:hypothetical protein GCM10012280_40190 [Wenjunlia tyrosinilytica]|uniref:Uncharacterized protein n=1 Tax=Wenjunlia tyrosinilytica TaxID=1544741 RepID=A0A918DYT2_9ACTN|nr:hypothetical protein GCM10012280_40190 [Wenjunlia tyrosinilytica]